MTGIVKSNKMTKAIVVEVVSQKMHSKYKKAYKVKKSFAAACADSSKFKIGQEVEIVSVAPVSKTIRFKVVE